MKHTLRPKPVAFACRGCALDGPAREAARALDREGRVESSVAGSDAVKARARFPIYVIEGCDKACAAAWLASLGVAPQRRFVLDASADTASEIDRIRAILGA